MPDPGACGVPSLANENRSFLTAAAVVQLAVILLVAIFGKYGAHADASDLMHSYHPVYGGLNHGENIFYNYVAFAVPVKLVVVLYFGLHLGGTSSRVPLHLRMVAATVFAQVSLVLESFSKAVSERRWPSIEFEIETMMEADKSCCGLLMVMTAIATASRPQASLRSFCLAVVAGIIACANEHILRYLWMASDTGLLFSVHIFGPIFGLTAAYVTRRKLYKYNRIKESPSCDSRITVSSSSSTLVDPEEVGQVYVLTRWITFILTWITWPSYTAALGFPGDEPHRAYLNTTIACSAALTIHMFLTSWFLEPNDWPGVKSQSRCPVALDHCIAGVASGCVIMSGVAFNMLEPIGAMLLGGAAGCISAVGGLLLAPQWICGDESRRASSPLSPLTKVYSSHLLPGIASGLSAAFVAAFAEEAGYGFRLYGLYEARSPTRGSWLWQDKAAASGLFDRFPAGTGRSAEMQGLVQLASLTQTIVVAFVAGGVLGVVSNCL